MTQEERECPFCAIIRGDDDSARIVCGGRGWLAFFPLRPATLGHTLIVPKKHVASLWTSTTAINAELMAGVAEVGSAIKTALSPRGLNLISSEGEVAEQTVFHLHLHLVPRWPDDNFGPLWPDSDALSQPELDEAAGKIRDRCPHRVK
jgi:histidine triad (HIT) family protein